MADSGDVGFAVAATTPWPTGDPEVSRRRITEAVVDPRCEPARAQVLELHRRCGAAVADRGTAPGHLTGSALVLDPDGRVLLLLHTKLGRWLQPGGHADGDHDLAGVALREAREETGIEGLALVLPAVDVDVHRVDHGDALGEHLHLDLRYLVLAPRHAVVRRNHESRGARWVPAWELPAATDDEGLVRLAAAGLAAAAAVGAR